jgi:tetratricopeptide (TPR) repeat protein
MRQNAVKYLFSAFLALFLILLIYSSRNAGITCDEILHYKHSVSVFNYFASLGEDKSALNTPVTHLKHYGQSFDNLVTIFIKWFDIEDVYGFRHFMGSVAGWLIVLITAVFAVWLSGYRTGFIVIILFALSPGFIGHMHNNLKDIPFALGYIAGTFYTMKVLSADGKPSPADILCLTLSMALCISIRAGGLILICYLFMFLILKCIYRYYSGNVKPDPGRIWNLSITLIAASIAAVILSISLWPYALQDPLKNIIESYRVMAQFPETFRQTFEGKNEWSNLMPWYYLLKSMAISIPLIVLAGLLIFIFFFKNVYNSGRALIHGFMIFTLLFPIAFVIFEDSNLYSSWRQFLFLYPGIILLSAAGYNNLLNYIKTKYLLFAFAGAIAFLSFHPLKFMIENHPYWYLYYNQFVGGLKGAYGNYETDYYYVSQTEAAEWLMGYLEEKKRSGDIKVGASSSIEWSFRKKPWIVASYFRYEERSMHEWDYAIAVNRYIPLSRLKNGTWPPGNAIKVIYADEVPVCAVLERKTHADYLGYNALMQCRIKEALGYFNEALKSGEQDEMIFYNFARALYADGQFGKADSLLKKGLELNPEFEPALMYLGNIAKTFNRMDEAARYYKELIGINRKYFEAYVELAELTAEKDVMKARSLLRDCLVLNPGYEPAIKLLADTYRVSDPDVADKYDKLLEIVK